MLESRLDQRLQLWLHQPGGESKARQSPSRMTSKSCKRPLSTTLVVIVGLLWIPVLMSMLSHGSDAASPNTHAMLRGDTKALYQPTHESLEYQSVSRSSVSTSQVNDMKEAWQTTSGPSLRTIATKGTRMLARDKAVSMGGYIENSNKNQSKRPPHLQMVSGGLIIRSSLIIRRILGYHASYHRTKIIDLNA
eukprot:1393167-Amorphochlora_amoeboformis.AAC.1